MLSIRRTLWATTIMACLGAVFSTIADGGNQMQPLYSLNEVKVLEPQEFDIGSSFSISLFPVPQDNSIGTNDLHNAITVMSFRRGRIRHDNYFRSVFEQVGGGGEFLPVISPDTIGFGQTRRFVLYNFRTKKHERYRIAASLGESIQQVAIADNRQRHFIFESKEYDNKSEDHRDYTSNLTLMDLSGEQPMLLNQIDKEKGTTWTLAFDKIFLYHLKKEQLTVLTTNFEPAHHPMADVINSNKGKINFTWIHPHPYLPFATLSGGDKDEVLVSWSEGRDKAPISLFGNSATAIEFSFSPDGKWVVFQNRFPEPKKTYLMPVSEKYPHCLGSPILLSNKYFNPNNFGWTTNPISFVGSSLNKLYRWELTNAAHPESDRATFHDYIVEHDLEKLTKEKRQGLGDSNSH